MEPAGFTRLHAGEGILCKLIPVENIAIVTRPNLI